MGMDPKTIGLMAAMLGGSALGGITAPQGQKLQSFKGEGDLDPRTATHEAKAMLDDYLQGAISQATSPVNLRTTVNPLPNFVGGALPMAISAPGQDANRLNPALRSTPGAKIQRRRLSTDDPNLPLPNGMESGDQDQAAAALQMLTQGRPIRA